MTTFYEELEKGSPMLLDFIGRFPDGIMILNFKGHVLYLNSASEKLLGRPKGEWMGKRWQYPLTEGDVRDIDVVHPNGQKMTLQIYVNQMTWEEQAIYLLVLRDVTRINQVTHLQQKLDRLEELDQRKNDFVSIVSHELRTPLAISLEGINLMNDGIIGKINAKQKNVLRTSKDNLDRLKKLIDNLLDISKIEAGRMELNLGLVHVNNLVKNVVASYQHLVASKKIQLKARLPKQDIFLCIDRDKIIQVLMNLLHNAAKFTPDGGKIEVILTSKEKEVIFQIKDSGVGMAKDDVKKLFNKFQQVGAGRDRQKGTGLGLFIAKSLVELHQGHISLTSEPGKGTTFIFSLPQLHALQNVYDQELNELVKQTELSKNSFSLIIIRLDYSHFSDKEFPGESPQEVNIFFEILTQMFSRIGDRVIYYSPEAIYIYLPNTNRISALSLLYQIKEKLLTIRLKEKLDRINVKLHFGLAVYPFDAQEKAGLVKMAMSHMDRTREIVIIDDDRAIEKLLMEQLDRDHKLSFTSNGKEALTIIQERKPDLIILNVMLPNINGYELLGRLKEDQNTSSIPIVLLTTRDTNMVQRESVRFGEIPLFNKSGDLKNLVALVKKLV